MEELKNCPFCGGHALIINCQTGMSTRGSYVACKKCNSEGATFNSYNGNHEELAAIAWNTRAVDTQIESLTAQLNEARAALERIANCPKTGKWYDDSTGYQEDEYELYAGELVEIAKQALNQQEKKI